MGGFGSGPKEDYSRIDIEHCLFFDLTMLKGRVDNIEPDQQHMSSIIFNSGRRIFIEFKYPELDVPTIELSVGEIITTLCFINTIQPLGGVRWWLKCPVTGRKCRKVFLPPRGTIFASRQAYGLRYRSQRLAKEWRLREKWQKMHIKLGGTGEYKEYFPDKPKYMHWDKYSKMYLKCEQLKKVSMELSNDKVKRFLGL